MKPYRVKGDMQKLKWYMAIERQFSAFCRAMNNELPSPRIWGLKFNLDNLATRSNDSRTINYIIVE
jgi:hypothetical protein